MSYSPHQEFISPARGSAEIWRTIAGIALCFSIYALGLAVIFPFLVQAPPSDVETGAILQTQSAYSPATTLSILFSFGFITLGAAISVQVLHSRSPLSLLGDTTQIVWYFWRTIKALLALNLALIILPPYGSGPETVENLAFQTWFVLLPLSLTGLLIQTSAEEIFFRGYLQQQLAARFSSPLIWMGIPAILFSLGHYDQANGVNTWLIVGWAALFSLAASDLVARTGNLGAAIGLHFLNNTLGMLIVSYPGAMSGLSLFVLTTGPQDFAPKSSEMLLEYGMLAVSWLAIRFVLRR